MMRVVIGNVFTFSVLYIFSQISRILVDFANLKTREIFFWTAFAKINTRQTCTTIYFVKINTRRKYTQKLLLDSTLHFYTHSRYFFLLIRKNLQTRYFQKRAIRENKYSQNTFFVARETKYSGKLVRFR